MLDLIHTRDTACFTCRDLARIPRCLLNFFFYIYVRFDLFFCLITLPALTWTHLMSEVVNASSLHAWSWMFELDSE